MRKPIPTISTTKSTPYKNSLIAAVSTRTESEAHYEIIERTVLLRMQLFHEISEASSLSVRLVVPGIVTHHLPRA